MAMDILSIARVCHEANRAYCLSIGDTSQLAWAEAPDWQKQSAENGVRFHLENPSALPSHSHDEWLKEKAAAGWKYGPVKDPEKKEHPCFVPYEQLPEEQKLKDTLFIAVVRALSGQPAEEPISEDRPPSFLAGSKFFFLVESHAPDKSLVILRGMPERSMPGSKLNLVPPEDLKPIFEVGREVAVSFSKG